MSGDLSHNRPPKVIISLGEGHVRRFRVVGSERETAARVHKLLVNALAVGASISHHSWLLSAFLGVAVARHKGSLELGVARHAPGGSLLTQNDGLKGLADVPAILPHRRKSRDHGREELVQAVRGDVACRATEEMALRSPQDGGEVIVRERAVTIVLEEGHEQRVHNSHVKYFDTGEKNTELLVLAGASGDAGIVLRIAANLLEEVCHLPGLVVAIVGHVTRKQAVHVARGNAGRGVDYRKPVAEEFVEDLVIAVGTKRLFNCAPVVGVEVLLLVHGKSHETKLRTRSAVERSLPVEFIDSKISCGLSWPCESVIATISRR